MVRHLSLKTRLVILICAMATAGGLIVALILLPTAKHISNLGQQIQQTERFMGREYERTRQLRKSIANLEAVTEDTRIFERAVIRPGEELRVITELEALAETHRIDQSLDVQFAPGAGKKLASFTFTFTNRGAFPDHVQYLKTLEQLPYYLFIDKLEWRRERTVRRTGPTEGPLIMTFSAKVFVAPEE
jgi:hypothetical protein